MWATEYRPKTLSDIAGHESELSSLKSWAESWNPDSNAMILHGPPGTGKTSAAHALANDLGWDVVEMNAGEKRTKQEIKDVAGNASTNHSLSTKKTLIILDEADNLHGNVDRGGKAEITRTVKNASVPIILIANNYYDMSRTLRNSTDDLEFGHLTDTEIAKGLRDICQKQNVETDVNTLKTIAKSANGDFRAAVNELSKNIVGRSNLDQSDLVLHNRDQKQEIFPYLDILFKKGTAKEAKESGFDLEENPEDLYRWVVQNIFSVYNSDELVRSLDFLANADRWRGRTRSTQNYKYWRYLSDNLTAGVASARSSSKSGWTRWSPPRYSSASGPSEDLLIKISSKSGCSMNTVRRDILPIISILIGYCKPEELAVEFAAAYDLDAKELSELTGSGKSTNKVERIISKAQEKNTENIIKDISQVPDLKDADESSKNNQDTTESAKTNQSTSDIEQPESQSMPEEKDNSIDDESKEDDNDQSDISDFL